MNQSLKRDTALATAAIYESMFAAEDGTIPATFQVILAVYHFNISYKNCAELLIHLSRTWNYLYE